MRDYIDIAECPIAEPCAQLGDPDYYIKAKKECEQFIYQLRRQFGKEVGSARLKIKHNPHDFGTYLSVICEYNDENKEEIEYAFKLESETPEYWDERAKVELGII